MSDPAAPALEGAVRRPGATAQAARVVLDPDGFRIIAPDRTRAATYRDLSTITTQDQTILVVLGTGDSPTAERLFLERFGAHTGALIRELRDRRLRQRLDDAFVRLASDERIELVEYVLRGEGSDGGEGRRPNAEPGDSGGLSGDPAPGGIEAGVAQLVFHPWGAVLAPLEDRRRVCFIRRGDIGSVQVDPGTGTVEVSPRDNGGPDGLPIGLVNPGFPALAIPRLGEAATRIAARFQALRDQAMADTARLVEALLGDAPYGLRAVAIDRLLDGHPASPATLGGEVFGRVEDALLTEPAFAESHAALVARAEGERWLALAPTEPGGDDPRSWTFVGLPGNLVALELLSAGAHATYCFRVVPRAEFRGRTEPARLAAVVAELSDALIDARFLREPMALPDASLAEPRHLRYRLALAALPSLAQARGRFVGRIVHTDAARWSAALDDLIRWNASVPDDALIWPGRAAEEAQFDATGESADPVSDADSPLPTMGGADESPPAGVLSRSGSSTPN